MMRTNIVLLKIFLLTGLVFPLMIFPRTGADACTPTVTPSPTPTATHAPPGVTPQPSLTPAPTLTYEQVFYRRAEVVFRGRIVEVERRGEWDEVVLVAVREYYKGEGGSVARVSGVTTFRLCNYFPRARGAEMVFYVNPAQDGVYYPVGALGDAPHGVNGRSPDGVNFSLGWMQTAALGFSAMGGALIVAWIVKPRR